MGKIIEVSKEILIKIRVTEAAKKAIEQTAEDIGLKEIAVASKLYLWFAKQPDSLRKGILGFWPSGMEDEIAKLALKSLAGENRDQ